MTTTTIGPTAVWGNRPRPTPGPRWTVNPDRIGSSSCTRSGPELGGGAKDEVMAVWMARTWGPIAAVFLALAVSTTAGGEQPVAVNQTEGFGAGQLLVFTYLQNFAC